MQSRFRPLLSFGQPGRTKTDTEDAVLLFIVTTSTIVGLGKIGTHHWVAPVDPSERLPSVGLGRTRRQRAFASHKVSALASERIALYLCSG
jgi:hypothetical protein